MMVFVETRIQSDVTELKWTDTVYIVLTNWPMGKQDELIGHWLMRMWT